MRFFLPDVAFFWVAEVSSPWFFHLLWISRIRVSMLVIPFLSYLALYAFFVVAVFSAIFSAVFFGRLLSCLFRSLPVEALMASSFLCISFYLLHSCCALLFLVNAHSLSLWLCALFSWSFTSCVP